MYSDYLYVVFEFNKETNTVERRIILNHCDPQIAREQFAPNEEYEPYIYDSYPIVSTRQAFLLAPELSELNLDFDKFDYFLEANQKSMKEH